ncbi:hypothetical protein ABZP36_015883 [Zizania latifolia]
MDALKSSCANLQSVVEDPLPAAKAAADEVLATRMDKAVSLNDGEVRSQPATCEIAGPSAPSDNGVAPRRGTPPSLISWNLTARTFQRHVVAIPLLDACPLQHCPVSLHVHQLGEGVMEL